MKESHEDKEKKLFFMFSQVWEAEMGLHDSKEALDERFLRTRLSSVHEEWQTQSWSCLQEGGGLDGVLVFSALFCRMPVKKSHVLI